MKTAEQLPKPPGPPRMPKTLLTWGNSKMGHLAIFNLPPTMTCTPTAWCLTGRNGKPFCYALRGNHTRLSVQDSWRWRYEQSLGDDFVDRVIEELAAAGLPYCRVHSTGDFYGREYIGKWARIAKACPGVKFRTSTRRRDFTAELQCLNALPNFVIRESLDTERRCPAMGLPVAAIADLPAAEYADKPAEVYHCPNHCPSCGYHCWLERCDVSFEVH